MTWPEIGNLHTQLKWSIRRQIYVFETATKMRKLGQPKFPPVSCLAFSHGFALWFKVYICCFAVYNWSWIINEILKIKMTSDPPTWHSKYYNKSKGRSFLGNSRTAGLIWTLQDLRWRSSREKTCNGLPAWLQLLIDSQLLLRAPN